MERLTAPQRQVVASWRAGQLDPGAAAYLLEIGNVALLDVAADAGDGPAAGAGPAAMRSWWSAILEARGIDSAVDLAASAGSLSDAQVFHLQHYAAWRAGSGRRGDLRQALAVQERVAAIRTEVARRETAGFAAKSAAARAGHELAAQIATDLALATPERERGARTQALDAAVRHARAALADPSTSRLLRPAGQQAATVRTARVVARALCVAASHGVAVTAEDAAAAVELLDCATGRSNSATSGRRRVVDGAFLATARGWRAELAVVAGEDPTPNE